MRRTSTVLLIIALVGLFLGPMPTRAEGTHTSCIVVPLTNVGFVRLTGYTLHADLLAGTPEQRIAIEQRYVPIAEMYLAAGMAPGSRLVFTYVLSDLISGENMHGGEKFHRRFVEGLGIWKFGLMPETACALLRDYGWEIVDDAGGEDYAARHGLGADAVADIMAIERIALAEKRG